MLKIQNINLNDHILRIDFNCEARNQYANGV